MLFENLGRVNKRLGLARIARTWLLPGRRDPLRDCRCVSRQLGEIGLIRTDPCLGSGDPEATGGYMVKRRSAHGGCLGGRRR